MRECFPLIAPNKTSKVKNISHVFSCVLAQTQPSKRLLQQPETGHC